MTTRRLPAVLGAAAARARAGRRRPVATTSRTRRASAQPQGDELVLTLGTKNFTEAFIVGELYRQALRSKGINVKLRKDIGPTEVIDKELQSGAIDAYPEYLGVAVTVAAGRDDAGARRRRPTRWRRTSTPVAARRSASRRRSRTSTRSPPRSSSRSAAGLRPSATSRAAALHARRPARVRGAPAGPGRDARRLRARQRRVRGDPDRRAVPARSTATRSTPRTSSPPTASSRAGATRCSRTPSASSASSTWRW